MLSDRDIVNWDQRLKDQANKGWDNYSVKRIDLTLAQSNKPLRLSGEFLYVCNSSSASAVATVRLNRTSNPSLDLEKGVEIKSIFTALFISNEALPDEWIDLIIGINFEYKKKIIDTIAGLLNFLSGGPLTTPAGVDLRIMPGAGGITQIGDAGATSRGFNTNDDLFVSGRLEVDGLAYFDNMIHVGPQGYLSGGGWQIVSFGSRIIYTFVFEIITVAIGNSVAVSAGNLAPADSIIEAVVCRVNQAPGGGPSHFDIGRTAGGNLDEYIDNQLVALNGRFNVAAHGDGSIAGPHYQAANDTLTITTTDGAGAPVNVAGADMMVRVITWYKNIIAPDA